MRTAAILAILLYPSVLLADGGIDPYAYLGADVECFEIPSGVVSVDEGTFAGSSLKEIVIPEGVVSIGDYAFSGCASLAAVSLPSSLRFIGTGAFAGCAALEDVQLPENVETIGDNAFRGSGLRKFVPGADSNLRAVGDLAFSECHNLSSVILPAALTYIGSATFMGCPRLSMIILPGQLRELPELMMAGDSLISEIDMPGALRKVGDAAMDGCNSLRRIDAVGLELVPETGSDVWHGVVPENVDLYVSTSAASTFGSDPQWGLFNIISGTTGIADMADDAICGFSVVSAGAFAKITAAENIKSLKIYTIEGRLLLSLSGGSSEITTPIPDGEARMPLLFSALLDSGRSVTTKVLFY